MMQLNEKCYYSNPDKLWEQKQPIKNMTAAAKLTVTPHRLQKIKGFGGTFNELGWEALSCLTEEQKQSVLKSLFDKDGCDFSFCRVPIGASDYAKDWYSHNEQDGDYAMAFFSIQRDYDYLIPYIKNAMVYKPELTLFASPWSPPTWMKSPKVYNYGKLVKDTVTQDAYALYFIKFIEAYTKEGIRIEQLHVQNEVFADQKFPSCTWTGVELRDFISNHLGPMFDQYNVDWEIWFGTINGPSHDYSHYDEMALRVLMDDHAKRYISGVGYQWNGKHAIQRTHESFPEVRLMQTENECGDGFNTWDYAHYVFNHIRHYFSHGVESYIYWNMVLETGGKSTWGWTQNTMITVDKENQSVTYNPEFYIMKHFTHFVKQGASLLKTTGCWTGNTLAFENPNGDIVVIMNNPFKESQTVTIQHENELISYDLEPYSINTILLSSK